MASSRDDKHGVRLSTVSVENLRKMATDKSSKKKAHKARMELQKRGKTISES